MSTSPASTPREPATSSTDDTSYGVGSAHFYKLGRMSHAELENVFLRGTTPSKDALAGWEFRGMNRPGWAKLAGIKKFIKGFHYQGDKLMGYNCPVRQNDIHALWIARPTDRSPKKFGFYEVVEVDAESRDNRYLHALLLDYGRGGNSRLDPSAGLRDYLVQVDPDDPDLYLGKAYYAVGPLRVEANFFILERHRPATGPISVLG
jgi:hypothetical protein